MPVPACVPAPDFLDLPAAVPACVPAPAFLDLPAAEEHGKGRQLFQEAMDSNQDDSVPRDGVMSKMSAES